MKNKEIEELLNRLKDNDDWYVIENKEEHNTEPYKLLLPTERNLLLSYIEQLENTIDDVTNISYKDYDSWLKNKDYVKDLERFANQINYDMHPTTTLAYRTSIKNAIKILVRRLKETYTEDTVNELKQEIKQLENKKDDSIEMLETYKRMLSLYSQPVNTFDLQDVIDTLKGDSDE